MAGDRISGAICFDLRTRDVLVIQSVATILATGGCGILSSLHSNPSDVTGDGFALEFRAGAKLQDTEFIQFYPHRCIHLFRARILIQPTTFTLGERLYNNKGEHFITRYDTDKQEVTTRDIAVRSDPSLSRFTKI